MAINLLVVYTDRRHRRLAPCAGLCGLILCLIRPYRNAAGFFCAACAGAASGMAARFIPFYSFLPDTLKLVALCTAASLLTAAFALPKPPASSLKSEVPNAVTQKRNQNMKQHTIFYDAQCPLCVREMALTLEKNRSGSLKAVPVQGSETELAQYGISPEDAMTYIHIVRSDGAVLKGMSACA